MLNDEQTCSGNTSLVMSIDRTKVQPGTLTMPVAGVSVGGSVGTTNCNAWTGTIQWVDVPSWSLTFNLTCSQAGLSSFTLSGTMSGQA
jgi:hypothetical protein